MNATDYQELSARTINDFPQAIDMEHIALWNAGTGIMDEGGEVLGTIKKIVFHEHPIDKEQLAEELGDVLWYISAVATLIGVDLGEIMRQNVEKLQRRYPNGFTPEDSLNRDANP